MSDHLHEHKQLERLTYFSDAVFAIAITLLVIEIHVPHLHDASADTALQGLADLFFNILGFFISFMVIGAMWISHHRVFGMLRRCDEGLLWVNLLTLLMVAFMPFSTAFMSSNSLVQVPQVFYCLTLLIVGLLQAWLIRKALTPRYLRHDLDPVDVSRTRWRAFGMPSGALLALLVALTPIQPGVNDWVLISIPSFVRAYAAIGARRATRVVAPQTT